MRITFHPRHLLITVLSLLTLWLMFATALNTRAGVAAALAFIALQIFFAVNPAAWGRRR
jgi:hypothetical protein